ncbi:hypothetical protein SM11_pD1542 (plasmid) [Sinorhizobium meliloti SM11]|uniref:Uncharacterized protein n=1 Tax=Sinorhizobium meliloti (strain SM11) TaxID=707241 RepID=F7XJF3_SINMM|nr:hypothetical protein SM11_pD1542 [Sinorhizobium meliloti SM11]
MPGTGASHDRLSRLAAHAFISFPEVQPSLVRSNPIGRLTITAA